jgi:hypothetical protein
MGRAKKAARALRHLSQAPYKVPNSLPASSCINPVDEQTATIPIGVHPDDIEITTETLQQLVANPSVLKSKSLKSLKTAVFEVHRECLSQTTSGTSLTSRISSALTDARWVDALVLLSEMRIRGTIPKLGSLQRWTRECDAASLGQGDGVVWDVLHAILRTTEPTSVKTFTSTDRAHGVQTNEPWISRPCKPGSDDYWTLQQTRQLCTPEEQNYFRSNFSVLLNTPGSQRRPPNKFPAIIYHSLPTLFISSPPPPLATRQEVPGVPGAFLLLDVLSASECKRLVQAAESVGMLPDEPVGGTSAAELTSVLAHNLIWLADPVFIATMYHRIEALLPQTVAGGSVRGINRRFRLYRYRPGAIYRPHIDVGVILMCFFLSLILWYRALGQHQE